MGTKFYRLANLILRLAFRVALDLKVEGIENVPSDGPLIVAINHTSFVDPLLVGVMVPRDVVMMSKMENFKLPIVRALVKAYGAFPIHRGEVDRAALKRALEVLREGGALLMAPEGTRSKDGQLQSGHDGLAMIAVRTGAPILPFVIAGAKTVSGNLARLRRTAVTVRIGAPFLLASQSDRQRASREDLRTLTDQLMLHMAELLPADQRGAYQDRFA